MTVPFSNGRLTRRDFLQLSAATAAAALVVDPATASAAALPDDLTALSGVQAIAAMKRGELTAERYAEALLARCKAAESLNAFITLRPDRVLESARGADKARASGARLGALHGLPIPIKDSVNTKDLPTTAGTPALRSFQPGVDAPLVVQLREAGAIVLGKTNLHEISMGYTSANLATGAVHNPYDTSRIPGGSSGGSAAAVASRMAPLSVAEDTAGSIRVPAAMCGIVGFRPTTGRYPTRGVVPMTALFDQVGPHARSVEDVVLFDAAITADQTRVAPVPLRGVKLGVVRSYYFADLDAEVARLMDDALGRLTNAGARIVELRIPDLAELVGKTALPIILHDLKPALAAYLAEFGAGVSIDQVLAAASANIRATLTATAGSVPSDTDYRTLITVTRPMLRQRFADVFASSGVNAIVFPTTPLPAVPITQGPTISVAGADVPFDPFFGRNVVPGSTTGLPGLVLPAGLTRNGLPVGIEFDGPPGSDRRLLGLGLSLQTALGPVPPPKIA
jgi:mandelamide amidase